MTIEEAMKSFKSGYDMCKKLGILPVNYSKWKSKRFIPLKQQHRINEIIGTNLPIDIDKESMEMRISKLDSHDFSKDRKSINS